MSPSTGSARSPGPTAMTAAAGHDDAERGGSSGSGRHSDCDDRDDRDDRDERVAAWCALVGLRGVGPGRLWAIADRDPRVVWSELVAGRIPPEWQRSVERGDRADSVRSTLVHAARSIDPAERYRRIRRAGVHVTTWGDVTHPAASLRDPHVPPVMFWRSGSPARLDGAPRRPAVGIVGTRRATRAGREWAHDLGRSLAEAGCDIVSGLALGIDAASHRGALAAVGGRAPRDPSAGSVTAVVGTGVDVVYPAANRELWGAVAERGRICSEYLPGTAPAPWQFPARNRILVAMSDVLVVVESHLTGGSLITAGIAGERGVPVLAVPGAVRSPASAGTNRLIADGCAPCLGVDDVLVALGLVGAAPMSTSMSTAPAGEASQAASPAQSRASDLPNRCAGADSRDSGAPSESGDPVEAAVLDAIGWSRLSLDEVVDHCPGHAVGVVMAAVANLTTRGVVDRDGGSIERRR